MILLINVKITKFGLSHYARASWLPEYDRVDIFKYCLTSYAAMLPLIDKCEFYIELAPEFADRREELENYIRSIYPGHKLNLNWYRHYYSRDWKQWCDTMQLKDDDIIWFAGNDDHIFMDYDLSVVKAGIKLLKEDCELLGQVYYSHWHEQIRLAYHEGGKLTDDKKYIVRPFHTFDAITMMAAYRWKKYWETDWGDLQVWRTDALWHVNYQLTGNVYTPTRELVRHYDGYSHVSTDIANIASPLFIPPGFFEKEMTIRVGKSTRDNSCTNFNPASEWLYNFSEAGTDYRWLLEDIPLFWRGHIKHLDVNYSNYQNLIAARNAAYVASTRVPLSTYNVNFTHENAVPLDWISNNIRG